MTMFRRSYGAGLLALSLAVSALPILTVCGCGGGSDVAFGSVAGWVYVPEGGGTPMISGQSDAPAGYEPVSGATLSIVDEPTLTATTDEAGYGVIRNIPPGIHDLVVTVPDVGSITHSVPVIAGQTTMAAGHEEGEG